MPFSCDLLTVAPLMPLSEAMSAEDVTALAKRLRKTQDWNRLGSTISEIKREIDPAFIRHRLHFDRMMHGGTDDKGKGIKKARGIRSMRLDANEGVALITVDGSKEWDKSVHLWKAQVRFSNYDLIRKYPKLTWTERARLLLKDNIHVHCSCPAYRFFHQHAATEKGFALVPESTPAPTNNPQDRGGICKHLDLVLQTLGTNYPVLAAGMKSQLAEDVSMDKPFFVADRRMSESEARNKAAKLSEDGNTYRVTKFRDAFAITSQGNIPAYQLVAEYVGGVQISGHDSVPPNPANSVAVTVIPSIDALIERTLNSGMAKTTAFLRAAKAAAGTEGAVMQSPVR